MKSIFKNIFFSLINLEIVKHTPLQRGRNRDHNASRPRSHIPVLADWAWCKYIFLITEHFPYIHLEN